MDEDDAGTVGGNVKREACIGGGGGDGAGRLDGPATLRLTTLARAIERGRRACRWWWW